MGKLTITSGPDKGRGFPLGDSQVLGRLGRGTIPLKDTRASREHARIYRAADGFHVVDLNSKNGILVNGEKVEKARLSPGDEVQIGDTWCKIDYDEAELAPAAPSGGRLPPTGFHRRQTPSQEARATGRIDGSVLSG